MHFSLFLSLLSVLSFATAHFKLEFPPARGFDEDTLPTFPCGGQNTPSLNRTKLSPTSFPLHLLMGHDEAAVQLLIGLGDKPGSNFNITLLKTFREEGLGDFCIDVVKVAGVDGLTAAMLEGKNATIQAVTNGDGEPAGGLYNCADVTFVSSGAESPAAGTCKNNTGVKTESLSTTLNANASNADGSPQKAGSASTSASSSAASSKATSSKAKSASSTGAAAIAMATAGWGVLGVAVMGAVAAL